MKIISKSIGKTLNFVEQISIKFRGFCLFKINLVQTVL